MLTLGAASGTWALSSYSSPLGRCWGFAIRCGAWHWRARLGLGTVARVAKHHAGLGLQPVCSESRRDRCCKHVRRVPSDQHPPAILAFLVLPRAGCLLTRACPVCVSCIQGEQDVYPPRSCAQVRDSDLASGATPTKDLRLPFQAQQRRATLTGGICAGIAVLGDTHTGNRSLRSS